MNLYEMTANAAYLYQLLDSGEIDEETVADTLEAMCVDDKLEGYCQVIGTFKAEIEMYKAEEARVAAKRKRAEKNVERLESAVLAYMTATSTESKKCGTFDLRVSRNSKTRIVDESAVDEAFVTWEQVRKIDRGEILKVLRSGGTVAGCELEHTASVRIK